MNPFSVSVSAAVCLAQPSKKNPPRTASPCQHRFDEDGEGERASLGVSRARGVGPIGVQQGLAGVSDGHGPWADLLCPCVASAMESEKENPPQVRRLTRGS